MILNRTPLYAKFDYRVWKIKILCGYLYNKAQFMFVCKCVFFCPGHICGPILKPKVPMDSL